jgi:hypothetical protein
MKLFIMLNHYHENPETLRLAGGKAALNFSIYLNNQLWNGVCKAKIMGAVSPSWSLDGQANQSQFLHPL